MMNSLLCYPIASVRRIIWLCLITCCFTSGITSAAEPAPIKQSATVTTQLAPPVPRVKFTVQLDTVLKHNDGKFLWFHPRPVAIPAKVKPDGSPQANPLVLLTLQRHLHVSDHYSGLYAMQTADLGAKWTTPELPKELDWIHEAGPPPVDVAVADVTPHWHARTGKVIAIGAQVRYSAKGAEIEDQVRSHQTAYAVYDPPTKAWTAWRRLEMPADERYNFARSACAQGVVEPDGTLLLPFYIGRSARERFATLVARCTFDGQELKFGEPGNVLDLPVARGLYEPSLIYHAGRYYLTLRNDKAGYVTTSDDGLQYEPIRLWQFDDGSELGSYNTQQHWVSHRDGLFLSYTRRGLNNDHVMRHRAPLLLAQVDPERLMVLRDTEQIIMPERGATFGNFGAARITAGESWITDAEGVFSAEAKKRGAEGALFLARVKWEVPNVESFAPATDALLRTNKPVKIVTFGDSVTGVYYHTGSRRAYTDMLGLALKKTYGDVPLTMHNAGISGHTTKDGLVRIDRDVLSQKPTLVTVMFGLNDMTRVSEADYAANLREITARCRAIGAEVMFCTPNAVLANGGRPREKLQQYCQIIHAVGKELGVHVADVYATMEADRQRNEADWRLLMSDEIHPNMDGHQRMAEILSEAISGRRVSLADVPVPAPNLKELLALAKPERKLKVIAMSQTSQPVQAWLSKKLPTGTFEVTTWDTAGKTLTALEQEAKATVRAAKPDLVVLTIPPEAETDSLEGFINSTSWLMNWSLNFGPPTWECVVVHPDLFNPPSAASVAPLSDDPPKVSPLQRRALIRRLVAAQDLPLIDRAEADQRPGAEILEGYLDAASKVKPGDE